MIDFANIKIKAGDGGEGAGSFVHIKGKRRGKADGGDGGAGGNVYFVATANLKGLEPFRFVKDYQAQNGQRGLSNKRKGAQGADLEIKVPVGTQIEVTEGQSDKELEDVERQIHDLTGDGQKVLIARGGEGGRGNCHLRDEYGRRPKSGEKGSLGEQLEAKLELKLIADVGLVGLPNAGKSTLIAALTSARPKIADYPFTTLEPNLGVMEGIVIADIPGLIEGASKGKGLGDLFLRHIERTKILVHLIDVSTAEDFWKNYQTIRKELKEFSKDLVKKQEIIVLNKVDLVTKEELDGAVDEFSSHRKQVYPISAQNRLGFENLVKAILKLTSNKLIN